MLLQEPWSSLGWPCSEVWGERLMKLVKAMKNEQEKTKKEQEKEDEKKKKQEEKKKKEEEKKKKTGAVDAKVKALAEEADASMKKIPAGRSLYKAFKILPENSWGEVEG
jgi:mannitol-specific phosphotransferase system IIBC component